MVFSTSKFDSLSIRPPTPPKDLEDSDKEAEEAEALEEILSDPFGTKPSPPNIVVPKSLLNTPEQSPSSDSNIPSSAVSSKKRVNFELQTCAITTPGLTAQSWIPLHSSPLRPLPQTRVSKPLKSILKPSDPTSTPPPTNEGPAAYNYKTFAEMLESVTKLLASSSRASRLDAYHSLQRTMQAYDKIPDVQSLLDKMVVLTDFIRRDIQATSISGNGLDSQLISQALKFLMALVRIPEIRPAMNDDFCSFLVDRIIQVAADASMPKTIVNTHLALLMQQTFRQKTMTVARVERVLDALDNIQERITGFSVQAYRIRIYRKLIQQRPEVMAKHTERWFKHTVKALLSGQKDINQSALDTAMCAAKNIGNERHVTRSVLSVLNRAKGEGETPAKVISTELEKMLDSENAAIAPQIWSAITVLLRGSLQNNLFPALGDWLKVLEKFFSSGNDSVKVYSNVAFCCLVYTVNITQETAEGWSKILMGIPQHQLQKRGPWKKSERDTATAGYFTLLYYSLRPEATYDQLDRYWKQYVTDFWNPLVHSTSPIHAVAACRVISALLNGSRKPWNEQRALDLRPHYMVQREELPLLEAKWVRRSLSSILQFVETLLDATPWTIEEWEDDPVKTMWLSLLNSLVEASSKEVMASTETKDALAHIVNLLRRVWERHTAKLALPQQKEDSWADKFCFLIETAVQKLGSLQFADKCLSRNREKEFEVAPTPSHRSRQSGPRTSPLLYLTDLLINQSEGKLPNQVRLRAMKLIIEPCLNVQNTRLSKLELLRDCSTTVEGSSRTVVALNFWNQIITFTKSCLEEQTADSSERVSRQLGKEYEVVVDIFESTPFYLLNKARGQEVLSSFADTVRREAGEGALILAVIEKVSERVLKQASEEGRVACLPFLSILLQNLPKSIIRRTLEQGRQALWPSSPAAARYLEFDPYNHFYSAVVSIGSAAYHELDMSNVDPSRNFLAALAASIRQCPVSLLGIYLRKIQEAIQFWVEDTDKKLQSKEDQAKLLYAEVVNLWTDVNHAIERLPRKDGQVLLHLESLITAGFLSQRRGIVNVTITTWNSTFGKEESLQYPARLEQALSRLRNTVELSLPSLEAQEDDGDNELTFYESDDSVVDSRDIFKDPRVKESPFRITKSTRNSRSPTFSSVGSKRRSSRYNPKVRLRHDNSQIRFEPIVSSPTDPFNQESQILTERQKEMVERQMTTSNIFGNIGTVSPRPEASRSIHSPIELHSDPMSADDLPTTKSRTPLKSLASLGPMDVYLGSSPTPSARNHAQQILSDDTNIATPTAVRTVRLANDAEELGSSPPRFEKGLDPSALVLASTDATGDIVGDSFAYRRPETSYSISFDEGTTVDEDALPGNAPDENQDNEVSNNEFTTDADTSEMPSSTIELQLDAQFDAEIKAQLDVAASQTSLEAQEESNNVYEDARSQLQARDATHSESDTELEKTQSVPLITVRDEALVESSNTSRVRDSFSNSPADSEAQTVRNLRRSSRHLATSSPGRPTRAKKRKQNLVQTTDKAKRSNQESGQAELVSQPVQPDEDGMLDNIVVASPANRKAPKRKHRSISYGPAGTETIEADASRNRSVRRSASLLSQVETHSESVLVEDTPATKRARGSCSRDVSEARSTPPMDSQVSQVKRLSHIQVTPKRSLEVASLVCGSSIVGEDTGMIIEQPETKSAQNVSMGEDNANVSLQVSGNTNAVCETEQSHSQQLPTAVDTPSRSFTERVILTPRSIINQLKNIKDYLSNYSQLVLGRAEEREFDDALFGIRVHIHAAARRGDEQQ